MTFRLTIDEPRWHAAIRRAAAQSPGLVPVIKGNGYGFGRERLAELCGRLGVDTVAVGTEAEIPSVRLGFHGTIAVMAPLGTADLNPEPRPTQVLRTVAHASVVRHLAGLGAAGPAAVLELDSPVHRHGVTLSELAELAAPLRQVRLAGVAMHLPSGGDRRRVLESVHLALDALGRAGIPLSTFWVSHLTPPELALVRAAHPGVQVRPRIGTSLWLGDRQAFRASGTVLDVRRMPHRQAVGYRQRRFAGGTLLVVSGGTAHGVGLYASAAHSGLRDVLKGAVLGAARGAGWAPSPFHWAGHRLHFADVAHMQVSMLAVPPHLSAPTVGDRLDCDIRMTVSTFDAVELRPGVSEPEASWPAAS
ncbi:alanine racemase [Kineosporia rhizophila]|uniref:alanine racemase n=1 Tax=Kineosporia rhizophila TaxID=84633 RepID=UPI001E384AA0|nr:alanine racemase [Kineosporia rhizophila]MCE0534274.1 alanine racemase [Kineosporia rhizophila]